MSFRVDKNLKQQADTLFKNLGINTTSAIMMFLKQCDREKGLPFVASMNNTNQRFLDAVKETTNTSNTFEEEFEDIDDFYE